MWPKTSRRKVLAQSEVAYLHRLQEIEAWSSGPADWSPSLENVGKGQAEFMGFAAQGQFADHYIVVDVEGIPTQSGRREYSLDWMDADRSQLLGEVTGYWVGFLRNSDNQEAKSSQETEFSFATISALHDFLNPMDISWYPAVQGFRMTEGIGFYSPDWRCGDEPLQ